MRKNKFFTIVVTCLLFSGGSCKSQDKPTLLWYKLQELASTSGNTWFIDHCSSVQAVMDSKPELSSSEKQFLSDTYDAFMSPDPNGNPSRLASYTDRQRPFILSWRSAADGKVSFSWLKLPKNWDPEKKYPLYIELHGLWDVANDPIEYMTYPYRQEPGDNFAFEDGYLLSPWGRGNLWYQGISETDIWECIAALEQKANIDPSRKYLCGHSMGGFGAWYIGSKSANTWAALGIHAGALWYNQSLLSDAVIETLAQVPVYFVVGTSDQLLSVNQEAYDMLVSAGDENTEFVTFEGGHDYLAENVQNMYLWMKNFVNEDWNVSAASRLINENNRGFIFTSGSPDKGYQLKYILQEPSPVLISLYDITGREIRILEKGNRQAGEYHVALETSDLSNGVYYCIMNSAKRQESLRILKTE